MDPTRFEYASTSYGGVVDFLIVRGPPASISQPVLMNLPKRLTHLRLGFVLGKPHLAFANPDIVKNLSSNIYEAKKHGLGDAIPQATMAAASYCRQHK
jgi:hypothetical protein